MDCHMFTAFFKPGHAGVQEPRRTRSAALVLSVRGGELVVVEPHPVAALLQALLPAGASLSSTVRSRASSSRGFQRFNRVVAGAQFQALDAPFSSPGGEHG